MRMNEAAKNKPLCSTVVYHNRNRLRFTIYVSITKNVNQSLHCAVLLQVAKSIIIMQPRQIFFIQIIAFTFIVRFLFTFGDIV
jgi:hypothetical protein